MKYKKQGFTLIELLVVITIISLISSIVFASVQESRGKANVVKAKVQGREIQKAIELGRLSRGSLPVNIEPVSIKSIVESESLPDPTPTSSPALKNDIEEYYSGDIPVIEESVSGDNSNDYIYLSDGQNATDEEGFIYLCGPGNPATVNGDDSVIFYEDKSVEWTVSQDDLNGGLWYNHPKLNNTLYAVVDTPGGLAGVPDFPSFARSWGVPGPFNPSATRRVLAPLWSPREDGGEYSTTDVFAYSCVK
jgi:prepilin-type N-terminal cleavage/methylation domain-containing protein